MKSGRALSLVALVSGIYDVAVGVTLLTAREWLARTFGVPSPQPPIFVELDALFLIAVGIGYLLPYRKPAEYRGYMWVMGPLLKGAGAATLAIDHVVHATPASFLLFAVTDGTLAVVTLWVLLRSRAPEHRRALA